ncbi:hypothetical protein ACHAXS_007103 [Conticribra weissflogii]
MIINIIQDIVNFANQFIPPITLFRRYHFSPADLAICSCTRIAELEKIRPPPQPSQSPSSHSGGYSSSDEQTTTNIDGAVQSSPTSTTITILTYNINHDLACNFEKRRNILKAIFSSGAQIIFLQETNPSWQELLHNDAVALEYYYCHYHHPSTERKDRPAGGIAILSQFPLENVQIIDFNRDISGSVFPALLCEVSILLDKNASHDKAIDCASSANSDLSNVVKIKVANVHLRPPVELDGTAWLDTARKTEPIRISEVKELLCRARSNDCREKNIGDDEKSTVKAQLPLDIIAGDFNEGDFGGAISYLGSQGYKDALQQFVPQRKETHTWPFMRNFFTLRKRLDHILWHGESNLPAISMKGKVLTKARLKCLGCGVLSGYETNASDHQPVLALFDIVREFS